MCFDHDAAPPDPEHAVLRSRLAVVGAEAHDVVAGCLPPGATLRRLDGAASLEGARFLVPGSADLGALGGLPDLPTLEVVQVLSAGTDWIEGVVPVGVTLCNARGARDAPVAEWVVGALLGATRGLLRSAGERRWEGRWEPAELQGATVVVLGFGSIGAAVAARLEPFGVHVVGVASRARDGVHGVDELATLLPGAAALVVLAPLTDATRRLVDARTLAALPDGALVINAGRGPVVDLEALTAEVLAGRLRAVLDVTDPEPLPPAHPLWAARGALAVTPHVAGDSDAAERRAGLFAARQLGRWVRGEPLQAVVRPANQLAEPPGEGA